jgi:ammonium transporter, Amt family
MRRVLVGSAIAVMGVMGLAASPVRAEDEVLPIPLDDTQMILDNIFIFVAAVLVLFMQAGFALVAAGLTSAKNVGAMMMKNMMDMSIGVVIFAIVGYHIAYSGSSVFGFSWLWGGYGDDPTTDYSLMLPVDFLFQAAFAAAAATIVAGAMAGRTKYTGYLIYTVIITGLIYPIVVNWQWGGGWLSEMGFEDFAGSTIVHSVGGWAALMGAIIVGPRIGKFGPDGKPRAIPGHNVMMAMTGVFILFVGWFGFNPGSQLAADIEVPRIAVNTLLAAAAGGVSMAGNGILGGLVSITAGAYALDGYLSLIAGAIGGIIVTFSVLLLEKLRVDDPVGAVSVHGVCGAWGTIAVGLFANSNAPFLDEGSEGLFFGGGFSLLGKQIVGVVSVFAFVVITAGILFTVIKKLGLLRVSAEDELAGLDVAEFGVAGYGPDVLPALSSSRGE